MSDVLLPAATTLGTAASLAGAVPQAVRTVVAGRTAGLAPAGLWLAVVINAVWLGYGIASDDAAIIAVNACTLILATAVLIGYRLRTRKPLPARSCALAGAALLAAAAMTVHGHGPWLAGAGTAVGLVVGLPQLYAVARYPGLDGVAIGSYVLALVGGLAWTTRWALLGDVLVAASAAYGAVVSAAVLILLLHRPKVAAAVRRLHACAPVPVATPAGSLLAKMVASR